MAIGEIKNIAVKGISCCLPDNKVYTTNYYDKFGKDNVDKFIEMSSVTERYVSIPEQCASDLAYVAAENLIKELEWDRKTIKGIIFITQSPDYRKPSTACILQHRLGLPEESIAFDVNLGCSAFVYGIWLSSMMNQFNDVERMLILIGDTQTKFMSPEDKSSIMLIGESGSAIALEKDAAAQNIKFSLKTDGSKFKSLYIPAGASRNMNTAKKERYINDDDILRSDYEHVMNGLDIFQFTISKVPKTIREFLNHFELNIDHYDYLMLHQANKIIVETIAKKLKFPIEKTPSNISKRGNCGGVSIPLLIVDELREKAQNSKLNLLVSGFGVGLSWGVLDLTLDKIIIPEIIYSNYFYKES